MTVAQRLNATHTFVSGNFFAAAILLIAVYALVGRLVFSMELPESVFHQPVLFTGVLDKRLFLLTLALTAGLLMLNTLPHPRNPFHGRFSWKALKSESGIQLRWVVFAAALVITWAFSTYEYNYYLHQPHYLDRILLVAVCIGVLISPVFTGFLVVFATVIAEQFIYPLVHFTWTDKRLLFEFLLLFFCFLSLRLVIRLQVTTYVFAALCLTASYYAMPGLTKLQLGPNPTYWVLNNELYALMVSGRVNGWLSFISLPDVLNLANFMKNTDILLRVFTIAAEAGCFFFLIRRRVSLVLLVMVCLLHAGIFLTSGILFWKWALLDIILFVFLWRNRHQAWLDKLYRLPVFVFSFLIILFADRYFLPVHLGWFDSRANNMIEFEAVTEDGQVYGLSRNFFAPYDVVFVQNRFYYLLDEPLLANTYGTEEDVRVFEALRDLPSVEGFNDVKQSLGVNAYDAGRAEMFDNFIRNFVQHHNERLRGVFLPSILPAPHHIITTVAQAYADQAPITAVRLRFIETYYTGSEVVVMQDRILREIEIPPLLSP